jgi:mannosyl-oligosaccharide alpha-1,2-mannosidase
MLTSSYRPEAIESIFIMYRITGETSLQDAAWRMFRNIEWYTKTKYGHAALEDTRDTQTAKLDLMESFWLAETLKYFYLIFSDPDVISLDEYVLCV